MFLLLLTSRLPVPYSLRLTLHPSSQDVNLFFQKLQKLRIFPGGRTWSLWSSRMYRRWLLDEITRLVIKFEASVLVHVSTIAPRETVVTTSQGFFLLFSPPSPLRRIAALPTRCPRLDS